MRAPKNVNPDRNLGAFLIYKMMLETWFPEYLALPSTPTKRPDSAKLWKIRESLNSKISDLGLEAINKKDPSRGEI